MIPLAVEHDDALDQLDVLANSRELPARDAARCAQLADTLRRPARVCLLGSDAVCINALARAVLNDAPEMVGATFPNAAEFRFAAKPAAYLTLQDGTTIEHSGWPTDQLLKTEPMFLQLELPLEILREKSFVMLTLGEDPNEYRPALSWAARRAEIAVWCTERFDETDAEIWAHVPEHMSHHAYLVEMSANRQSNSQGVFTDALHLEFDPGLGTPNIHPLMQRLDADIDDARVADLDAAQVLLYRLRRFQTVGPTPSSEVAMPDQSGDLERIRRVLSGTHLFLQRRARAFAEDMIWASKSGGDDWPAELLRNVCATAEAIRERAMDWPDEIPQISRLNAGIDEICDTVTLLQMEGGAARAADAAALLWQLRADFLQVLYPAEAAR